MNYNTLVSKAKQHDSQAWSILFEQTQHMVYFTTRNMVGNESDAEDLVQETYFNAYRHLDSLKDAEAFPGWIKRIAVNVSKNHLVSNKILFCGSEELDTYMENIPEVDENFLPQEYIDNKESLKILLNIVNSLPETQRRCVMLYYHDQYSISEISEMLQIKEGTVKSHLNRARNNLKKQADTFEKKGIKLHATAIPSLALLLYTASKGYTVSAATKDSIMNFFVQQAMPTATSTTSTKNSQPEISSAVPTTSKFAAKSSGKLFTKLVALPEVTKVAIGTALVCILGGAALIGGISNNNQQKHPQTNHNSQESNGNAQDSNNNSQDSNTHLPDSNHSSQDPNLENENIPENSTKLSNSMTYLLEDTNTLGFLAMTENEIRGWFGEPGKMEHTSDHDYYLEYYLTHETRPSFQTLTFYFSTKSTEPEYPVMVTIRLNEQFFHCYGITPSMTSSEIRNILLKCGWISESIETDVFTYNHMSYQVNQHYTCTFIELNEQPYALSFARDYSLIQNEPSVTPEPTKVPEENKPAGMTNQKAHEMLEKYFKETYYAGGAYYCFADVTHDGIDEMFVLSNADFYAAFDIIRIEDDNFQMIYSGSNATDTNSMYSYYLYEENGKSYLLYAGFFNRQGYPWYFYDIFHLDENGNQIRFKGNEYSGEFTEEAEEKMQQILSEYKQYCKHATLILDIDEEGECISGSW